MFGEAGPFNPNDEKQIGIFLGRVVSDMKFVEYPSSVAIDVITKEEDATGEEIPELMQDQLVELAIHASRHQTASQRQQGHSKDGEA